MSAALAPGSARRGWPRRVVPEILDALPAEDPRARRSRRDLRTVNRLIGARAWLLRGLDAVCQQAPARLIELGAGDGSLALRIARARAARWPGVTLTLVDREPSVTARTAAAIEALGWKLDVARRDAVEWLESQPLDSVEVALANLFVHHFDAQPLARLLDALASRSAAFVCCEPRRSRIALGGSRLLGLIGCNAVTRHDAVVSVHAGFHGRELSAQWPAAGWRLHERSAPPFSHVFVARRER